MGLKCGIVGLPNVGKSTLFNCLSNAKAQAANFPFCTIEPNLGVITVPDDRLNQLETLVNEVESFVQEANDRERSTAEVGELLMERLRKLDKVAYVRFASVYLDFKDIKEFMAELRDLLKSK